MVCGSSKVNTGEKGKETKLGTKQGFALWEEVCAQAVWLTALVLVSLMELQNWDITYWDTTV